jgi:hypothetical protein
MAFTDSQIKEIVKVLDKYIDITRPPLEIRHQLDIAYRITGQSVYIYEVRPRFDNPEKIMNIDVAKTTYDAKNNQWKIYWIRANLKWYIYPPQNYVKTINEWVKIVEEDKFACFWG